VKTVAWPTSLIIAFIFFQFLFFQFVTIGDSKVGLYKTFHDKWSGIRSGAGLGADMSQIIACKMLEMVGQLLEMLQEHLTGGSNVTPSPEHQALLANQDQDTNEASLPPPYVGFCLAILIAIMLTVLRWTLLTAEIGTGKVR
jgi:hypothetical protein